MKFIKIIVITSVFFVNLLFSNDNILKVAVDNDYKPFSYYKNGKLVGFEVELAKALCKELRKKCELIPTKWNDLFKNIKSGKVDIFIDSANNTKKRREFLSFSSSYYSTPIRMMKRKDKKVNLSDKEFSKLMIGVLENSIADEFIKSQFESKNLNVVRYSNESKIYKNILAGKLDVVIADELGLLLGFLNTKKGKSYELFGTKYTSFEIIGEGVAVGSKKSKQNQELMNEFSKAISRLRVNGVYKKINDKYFSFDIYK